MIFGLSLALAVDLALVGTASSGGVGSGRTQLQVPDTVGARGVTPTSVQALNGAMVRGRQAMWADDGLVSTLEAFLAHGGPCGDAGPMAAVEGRDEVLFVPQATAPTAFDAGPGDLSVRRCGGPAGDVWLSGLDGPPVEPGLFEYRLALDIRGSTSGSEERVWAIGRPRQELSRRVALIEALMQTGAAWLDGGSFVDGVSTVDPGALNRHRPLGFDILRRLRPTVLVPGATELAAGPVGFLAEGEGLPYVAANWHTEVEALLLPAIWRGPLDGVDVAVIGLIDPIVAAQNPAVAAQGVTLGDPVVAAQQAIDAMAADPPAVTVVLGAWGPGLLARLQRDLAGVDVLIGDPSPSVLRLDTIDVAFQDAFGGRDEASLTLPVQGVAFARLQVEEGRMVGAVVRPSRITPDIDPDEDVLARITAVRREANGSLDHRLLPAPPAGPLGTWTKAEWRKLLCEAVLEQTGADIAFLPELPPPPAVPGPLTDKLLLDQLPMADRLVGKVILGDRLQRLSDKAFEVVPVACGIDPGATALVGGRAADLQRVYRLVSTDRLLADGPVGALVAEALPTRLGDRTTWPVGERASLVGAIHAGLLGDEAAAGLGADPAGALQRTPADKTPLWLLRMTRIAMSAARFQGVEDDAYVDIPETSATSPSSLTLLADVDAGLEYSDARLAWDVRQRLLFTRLSIETPGAPADVSEPADDWRSSSSITVPAWGFDVGSRWSPYSELLLDSEVTAVENEDGTTNPGQADLSLTLGLSTTKGVLKLLRVGGFGLRDLSVLDKPWELGGRAEASVLVPLGTGLSWSSTLDGFVFADTPETDTSDLRFKALLDSRVSLALTRWLAISPYGQAFAFSGRDPSTSDAAVAWTLGSSLDLAGALQLGGFR